MHKVLRTVATCNLVFCLILSSLGFEALARSQGIPHLDQPIKVTCPAPCPLGKAVGYHVCVLSCFSHVCLFATPWTVACQAPLSMDSSSKNDYWSGLPCPPMGDLPNPGMEPMFLTSPALAGGFFIVITT